MQAFFSISIEPAGCNIKCERTRSPTNGAVRFYRIYFFISQPGRKIKREGEKMKKKWEVRYFVTAVTSVPVYKAYSKTETYK